VPLLGARGLQGVLSLQPRADAGTDPLDPELLLSVGQQGGLAVDRALLHEQSASVAHELQHALLAVDAPLDTRFAVAATYRAGVEMLEVGGDWYDVYLAGEGVLSVVVGDVVGPRTSAPRLGDGSAAAAATARVSEPVWTSPATCSERMDRFVASRLPAARSHVIAHASSTLATGLVRLACAGHPPPVLVPRSGPPRLLWTVGRRRWRSSSRAGQRTDTTVQIAPGDRLPASTPTGSSSAATPGLDDGASAAARAGVGRPRRPAPLDSGAVGRAWSRHAQSTSRQRDNVCVLLLEWVGPVFERRLPADLRTLAEVRHDLRRWLADRGLDHRMTDDVVLATSETLANAAEHGSGSRPTERVHLRVQLEQDVEHGDEVVVRVTDRGRWRPATSTPERGRGLLIARALVDDVVVETGEGTSVLLRRRLRAS
jgi:anti-sigma regulatory factor (Ser/Thr protein kinase)